MFNNRIVAWKTRWLEARLYLGHEVEAHKLQELLVAATIDLQSAGIVADPQRLVLTHNPAGMFMKYHMSFPPDNIRVIDPDKQATFDRLIKAGYHEGKS